MIKTEEELVRSGAWGGTIPDEDFDIVNHPAHYTAGSVECIDAIDSAVTGLDGYQAVYTAQIIKYVYRWKRKGGAEDLRKARWYLDRLLKKLEEGE